MILLAILTTRCSFVWSWIYMFPKAQIRLKDKTLCKRDPPLQFFGLILCSFSECQFVIDFNTQICICWIVLKALLKSMNAILTRLFACSRCSYMLFVKVSSASSTPLSARYANWFGYKSGETSHKSCFRIIFSKHFITVDVRATGCRSLSSLGLLFLGTGTIRDPVFWGQHWSLRGFQFPT